MIFFSSILFGLFFLRLWLSGFGGLHPDEAYYWAWSQKLDLGYFDHPPMLAWCIALGRWLVAHLVPEAARNISPLFWELIGLRIVPLFLSIVVGPLAIGKSIEWVQRKPIKDWQMIAIITSPLFILGTQFITPDIPLFAGWSLCLMITVRFLRSHKRKNMHGHSTPFLGRWALFLGIALAFSAYSKYPAVLAALLIVMTGAGLYNSLFAGFIALLLTLPYFYWNYSYGLEHGAGIIFQLKHGLGQSVAQMATPLNFKRAGDLIGSQLLLWTPGIFIGIFVLFFTDIRRFFTSLFKSQLTGSLFLWAFLPLGFFYLASLKQSFEANWPLIGAVSAIVMLLSRCRDKRFWPSFLIFNNLLILGITYTVLFKNIELARVVEPYSERAAWQLRKPSRVWEFFDWKRFYNLTEEIVRSHSYPIEVRSYQILAELYFHDQATDEKPLEGRLKIWLEGTRKSQFNFWPEFVPTRPSKARWLLASDQIRNDIPEDCKEYTNFQKSLKESDYYIIYKCGFE